jgi:hypothetical protein
MYVCIGMHVYMYMCFVKILKKLKTLEFFKKGNQKINK